MVIFLLGLVAPFVFVYGALLLILVLPLVVLSRLARRRRPRKAPTR